MAGATAAAGLFALDPTITYLNHGAFGACPRQVLEEQRLLRDRMEREPVRFFLRELEELLDAARATLAAALHADPAGLAFVANATAGVGTVLRSLALLPGDELLTTSHVYNACRNALEHVAERSGARLVIADVPFPLNAPDEVIDCLLARLGPRTRLALVDHVTSPTALALPVEQIVPLLAERGVDTLVDGAHAPGMQALDLDALGAAFYVGNCHKWLCAPKGAGFLWVRADRREQVRPLAISHGASSSRRDRSRFLLEFDWIGTMDPTPFLCVPAALRFLETLAPGGLAGLRARNHALALEVQRLLAEALGVPLPAPATMIGSMASLPLPDSPGEGQSSLLAIDPLQDALYEEHGIEVPIIPWPRSPHRLLRVSAQVYNRPDEYRRLAAALCKEIARR